MYPAPPPSNEEGRERKGEGEGEGEGEEGKGEGEGAGEGGGIPETPSDDGDLITVKGQDSPIIWPSNNILSPPGSTKCVRFSHVVKVEKTSDDQASPSALETHYRPSMINQKQAIDAAKTLAAAFARTLAMRRMVRRQNTSRLSSSPAVRGLGGVGALYDRETTSTDPCPSTPRLPHRCPKRLRDGSSRPIIASSPTMDVDASDNGENFDSREPMDLDGSENGSLDLRVDPDRQEQALLDVVVETLKTKGGFSAILNPSIGRLDASVNTTQESSTSETQTSSMSQTSESESPSLDSQFSSQQYSFGSSQESIPPALEREEEESDDEEEEAQENRFLDLEGEEYAAAAKGLVSACSCVFSFYVCVCACLKLCVTCSSVRVHSCLHAYCNTSPLLAEQGPEVRIRPAPVLKNLRFLDAEGLRFSFKTIKCRTRNGLVQNEVKKSKALKAKRSTIRSRHARWGLFADEDIKKGMHACLCMCMRLCVCVH